MYLNEYLNINYPSGRLLMSEMIVKRPYWQLSYITFSDSVLLIRAYFPVKSWILGYL
jgi:hypothetical protein